MSSAPTASLPPYVFAQEGTYDAPFEYTVPGSLEIRPDTASATFDGTGAGGSFLACLTFYDAAGNKLCRMFNPTPISAGDVAEVTYIPPFGSAASSTTPSGSGIQFDTDNEGGWLDVTTNNTDPHGHGTHFLDKSGGGILLDLDTLESQLDLTTTDATLQAERDVILETNAGAIQLLGHTDVQAQVNGMNTIEAKLLAGPASGLGFFAVAPVIQQAAPSSSQDIADALAAYGLLAGPGTIPSGGIDFGVNNTGTYLDITTTSNDGAQGILLHDTDAAGGITIESDNSYIGISAPVYVVLEGGIPGGTVGYLQLDTTGAWFQIVDAATSFRVLDHAGTALLQIDEAGNFFGSAAAAVSFQGGSTTPATMQVQDTGMQIYIGTGQTFTLYDASLNPILQMTDGSPDLHIPTGGTVVADL